MSRERKISGRFWLAAKKRGKEEGDQDAHQKRKVSRRYQPQQDLSSSDPGRLRDHDLFLIWFDAKREQSLPDRRMNERFGEFSKVEFEDTAEVVNGFVSYVEGSSEGGTEVEDRVEVEASSRVADETEDPWG